MLLEKTINYNGCKIWKHRNNQYKSKAWNYFIYFNNKLITLADYGKFNFFPKSLKDCKYLIDNFLITQSTKNEVKKWIEIK